MSANSRLTVSVHALCWLELARRRGESALTSERIAASLDSNSALVRKVLGPLREAGLVATERGPGGGWFLARSASEITLADVWAALGPEGAFALHAHVPNLGCPVGFGIRPVLSDVYADVQTAITAALTTRTIADVLDTVLTLHPLSRSGAISG